MVPFTITDYLLIAVIVWLALLSFYLIRTARHYKRLVKGEKGSNLVQILENLLAKQEKNSRHISEISSEILKNQREEQVHFQKSALIRFNPFEDAGGDQSFVLALLDGTNNGVVISSLHARGGTRIYAKEVMQGKSARHPFSKEEKEAVEKACQATGKTAHRD